MTAEQRTAREQVATWAEPLQLRVTADPEGWPWIQGRLGQIEWHDPTHLAVYASGGAIRRARILAIPQAIRHQIGDTEVRVLIPVARLADAAKIIGARRQRRLSPEQRAQVTERLTKFQYSPAAQSDFSPPSAALDERPARGIAAPPDERAKIGPQEGLEPETGS